MRFEFEYGTACLFYLYFISFGESRLLVSWCAGDKCGIARGDDDRGRSRRPGVEDRRWSHKSGDAVCGLHCAREDEEREFLG